MLDGRGLWGLGACPAGGVCADGRGLHAGPGGDTAKPTTALAQPWPVLRTWRPTGLRLRWMSVPLSGPRGPAESGGDLRAAREHPAQGWRSIQREEPVPLTAQPAVRGPAGPPSPLLLPVWGWLRGLGQASCRSQVLAKPQPCAIGRAEARRPQAVRGPRPEERLGTLHLDSGSYGRTSEGSPDEAAVSAPASRRGLLLMTFILGLAGLTPGHRPHWAQQQTGPWPPQLKEQPESA